MDMANKGLFTSNNDAWETPQDFFDNLNWEFGGFTLDVCATADNAKCEKYFTPEDDGLSQDWSGHKCWMNPPYGREISKWVKKAYEEAQKPQTMVVCLLTARTDTSWWHDYVMKGEVRFIRGRLRFGKADKSALKPMERAPFPSAVVIFR
jgi:phage N-6-adenine-methyltransferase